MIFMYQTQLKI